MRIIDRYILRTLILIFLSTVFIFSILFVLIDSAVNLDEFISRKASVSVLLDYYSAYLTIFLAQSAALAFLIAAMLTYSHLNTHNEIIALRTGGLNFWQISRPALCVAVLVSGLTFVTNERLLPKTEDKIKRIRNENLILEVDRDKKKLAKISNLTFYGQKNRLYFIDSFDPNTSELTGITIVGYDNQQNIKEKIIALNGKWTGIAWKFFQCHITTFAEDLDSPAKVKVYTEKLLDIKETPEDFLKQRLDVRAMNTRQLKEYIGRFEDSGAKRAISNLQVDLHEKIAFPFANFVIVLTGLPLALLTGRRKAPAFTALGIAIVIGFFYYVFNAVGLALGKGGVLPPILAAWFAPLFYATVAGFLIKTKFT